MRLLIGSLAIFLAGLAVTVVLVNILMAPVIVLTVPWAQAMEDAITWAFLALVGLGIAELIFR